MTLRGQNLKVTVIDVKYIENGKSYDVGPIGGYVHSSSLDLLPKIFGFLAIIAMSWLVVNHFSNFCLVIYVRKFVTKHDCVSNQASFVPFYPALKQAN